MSKILSIETSCEYGSIALLRDEEVLSRTLPAGGNTHSGTLLPAIKALLAEAGTAITELDVVAFGRGPGAFTGVRLACGVAQGLALGGDLPVAAIGSLEALALPHAVRVTKIYCAMDARMNEVYVAMFSSRNGVLSQRGEIVCVPPDAAPVPDSGDWSGVGNAFGVYSSQLTARLSAHVNLIDPSAVPVAESVARLAAVKPDLWLDAALAAPDYVRNRVALTTAERLAQGGKA